MRIETLHGFTNIKANLEVLGSFNFDDVTLLAGWHVVNEEKGCGSSW